MAVKDLYVDFEEFKYQVLATETGILRLMALDLFNMLEHRPYYFSSPDGPTHRDMMYMEYPFIHGYEAYCGMRDPRFEEYRTWRKEYAATADEETELPYYTAGYNFECWMRSRFSTIVGESALTPEEYQKYKDSFVIVGQDRTLCYIVEPGHGADVITNFSILVDPVNEPEDGVVDDLDAQVLRIEDPKKMIAHVAAPETRIKYTKDEGTVTYNLGTLFKPVRHPSADPDLRMDGTPESVVERIRCQCERGQTTIFPFPWYEY